MQLIISGTGTGVGKTIIACAVAKALAALGPTKAIKPYETGVSAVAVDAAKLEQAAGQTCEQVFFRAAAPLAPAAFPNPPTIEEMAQKITREMEGSEHALVESAGGLFVPLGHGRLFADLATLLALPIVLVTYDGLGTLSHTLAAIEAAKARDLPIAALVLNRGACETDPSQESNQRLLTQHCDIPIIVTSNEPLSVAVAATELIEQVREYLL